MNIHTSHIRRTWLVAHYWVVGMLLAVVLMPSAGAAERNAPTMEQVEKVIADHLARKRDYQPGDLITRADMEPIFNRLLELGVEPANRETLYDQFLPYNSFLASELSMPAGRKFMRQVSKYPNVYDRLERLSWMPAGRELIREMTQRADGPEVLLSLTTPQGAKAVEQIMAGDIRGQNFHLPTGHIHTAEQLIQQLRESHKQDANGKSANRS